MAQRPFSTSTSRKAAPGAITLGKVLRREYFFANANLGPPKAEPVSPPATALGQTIEKPFHEAGIDSTEPPHRRRKRLKAQIHYDTPIPLDASSRLSSISSAMPAASLRRLLTTCLSLSKPRLSALIVLTTASAYSLYPVPALLLPSTTISPSLSALTLVFLTSGTALCCASANALNMLFEPKYDAMMSRTRNRPLVRGLIGKRGALVFATTAGVFGIGSLWFGVNPTTAFLGGLNIVLYAGIYTPMKRISVVNTWLGALVGGIPPLMGWAAAAGQSATGSGEWRELLFSQDSVGGWLLAGLLFAWQFPHFNSLSWPIREEYRNAGYRMLAWVNPRMNGRVALRYAILCFPLCVGLWWFQITDQGFLVTSSVVNAWMVKEAWRFWVKGGQKGSARGLFWASVWHLPVVMVLAMVHKKGLWTGIWKRLNGETEDDEEWMEGIMNSEREELEPVLQSARTINNI
ncbi:Protoheme IX farnesyltransferase, mitochondrial [Puttea exsequens]|nr:Protoheme IX farnesyltransferase, mitochondrial [Puttea exsequens]